MHPHIARRLALGPVRQFRDELAKAITKTIYPALKPEGFRRARRRDLVRVENGIVQGLYFQVSAWGSRDFCITAFANLLASSERPVLQPGFRLTRDTDGGDLWLPSFTSEEAQRSAEITLRSIKAEALPYFERLRTVAGFSEVLSHEQWGSTHHLRFQQGVAATLEGDAAAARQHLFLAIELYKADGRDWCAGYVARANRLLAALDDGSAGSLLAEWAEANKKAHGIH
jgi:hypothetical protein